MYRIGETLDTLSEAWPGFSLFKMKEEKFSNQTKKAEYFKIDAILSVFDRK